MKLIMLFVLDRVLFFASDCCFLPVASSLQMFLSQVLSKDELMKVSGKKTNPELLVPCFQLQDTDHEGWMTKQGGWTLFVRGAKHADAIVTT